MPEKEYPQGKPSLPTKVANQLDYGDPFNQSPNIPNEALYGQEKDVVDLWMESFAPVTDKKRLDDVLSGGNKEDPYDQIEEYLPMEGTNKTALYNVTRDKGTGNIIRATLKDGIEGINIDDTKAVGEAYTALHNKKQLYGIIKDYIDPETEYVRNDLSKSFVDNVFDNTLVSNFTKLTAKIMGKATGTDVRNFGKYSLGVTGKTGETEYLNNFDVKEDGIYYLDKKLPTTPQETEFLGNFFGKKFTYKPDSFAEQFLNTAMSFTIDAPLFLGAGGISGKAIKYLLPGISKSTQLPVRFLTHLVQTNATLTLAEAPGIINHTSEGGLTAFADDMKRIGEFSLAASIFGLGGEMIGTGASKLLQKGRNLQMSEAVRFLNRNPQITKMVSTGITSGMLGYATTDGSFEDKLAVGMTFASMHFANVEGWKGYLKAENKKVLVNEDGFNSLKKDVKGGKSFSDAIRDSDVGRQRYYIEEDGYITEIDGNKFASKGEIEKIFEENKVKLTKDNVQGYKYITQAMPFAKKSLAQAWKEEELLEIKRKVYDNISKEHKNPHDVESDEYKAFELNKSMTASTIGDMIYANKLQTALRNNELPKDVKLDAFINKTAEYFNIPPRSFERHIMTEMVGYLKDPKNIEAKYKFMPEEYQKQLVKGLFEAENAIESTLVKAELDRILSKILPQTTDVFQQGLENVQLPPEPERKRPLDVKEYPLKKTSETKKKSESKTEIPIVEVKPKAGQNKLVDEAGNPLTKKLTWREQYERDRQQGKVVPIKAGTPVDKYDLRQVSEKLSSLNEALEQVDNPRALIDRIKTEAEEARLAAEKAQEVPYYEDAKNISKLADKITKGEKLTPEDLQLQANYGKELEAELANRKAAEPSKVTPVEEVVTREQSISKSREKQAKLERELLDIQEKMAKSGMTEEQIKGETYENPESAAGKKLAEIFNEDAARHALQNPVEVGKGEFKAVKLASGEVITFKEAGGHLAKEFAKLPKEVRDTIVDTGVTNERNEFKSTAVVKIEDYKQALDNIAQRLLKGGGGSTVVEGAKGGIFSPDMLRDLVTVGVHHFERGFTTFKDWSRRVLKDLGNRFKPYLTKLWQSTLDFLKTGIKDIPPSDDNTFGMFLGQMATSFGEAKRKGKVYEEGKEQKFFISDKDAKVGLVEGADFAYRVKGKTFKTGATFNLTDILDHPKLYANYPDLLNDWKVQLVRGKSDAVASISVADRKIKLNLDNVEDVNSAAVPMVIKNSILHEVQHFIQDKEGWALGSGSNYNLYEMPVALDKLARHLESRKNDEGITWDAIRMNFSNREAYTNAMLKGIEAIKRGDNLVGEQGAKIFKAIENEVYNLSKGEIEARLTEAMSSYPEMETKYAEKAFEVQLKEEGVNPENVIIDRGRKADSEIVYSGNEPVVKEKKGERTREEEKTYEKIQGLFKTYKPKNVGGKLKGTTLDPESYAKMNNLNTLAKMEPEEINTHKEQISKDLIKLEEKRLNDELTQEQYEEQELAAVEAFTNLDNFGNLEGKRGKELQDALGEIKTVVTEGRTRHRILEEARQARMSTLRSMLKTSFGNKEGLSETEAKLRGLDPATQTIKERIGKGLDETESSMMFGLDHILQKIFPADYKASKYIMEQTKRAESKEAEGLDSWEQVTQNKLREIYKKTGRDLLKELNSNKEVTAKTGIFLTTRERKDKQRVEDEITAKYETAYDNAKTPKEKKAIRNIREKEIADAIEKLPTQTRELPLSQNQAFKKWMEWQDKIDGEPKLRNMDYTDETIKQIETFLKPEIKEWANWQLKEFYPEYYKPTNEVFRRQYYVNLPQHENYSPFKINTSRVQEDNLFKTSSSPIVSMLNYSLYSRVKNLRELSYVDGNQVLMSHIAQMEHFKAWSEHIRELRSILQHSEIKDIIKENYGDKYNTIINRYINDLARGSVARDKIIPILDSLRNNFTTAVLAIPKLNLLPQQMSSIFMYATEIPTEAFMSGTAEMLADPMKAYHILYDNSAKMRARYKEGFDRDIKDVMARSEVQKLAGVRSWKDTLMYLVKMGDKAAVVGGGYAVWKYHYDKAIGEGLSPEQAMEKAINKFDVATDRTQQSSQLVDQSELQRGGSFGKLFTMFQSQPNLYYRATSLAVRDLIRGKGDPARHGKTILLAHFVLPMLFQFIADFGWDTKHQVRAGALGSFNGLFAIGDILSNTVAAIQNDTAYGIEAVPLVDAPNKFISAMQIAGKAIDEGDIDTADVMKMADRLASSASRFIGVPYDPTKKVVAGLGVKANQEGVGYGTENINLKRVMGVSELAIKDSETEMKKAKRRMTIYKKKYQKTSDADDRSAYIEARREYERIVKELKLNERKK